MNIKNFSRISLTMIMVIFVYFIWNSNRQKEVARNELPPLKIEGIVQGKKDDEFSINLSEDIEDLKKGEIVEVKFSKEVFDDSNIVLNDSEIKLYSDSLRIGEPISIFYPMDRISKNKKIEINRISNISRTLEYSKLK